jgi:hypothetical protein
MNAKTRESLLKHFAKIPADVLASSDVTALLEQNQTAWNAYDVSGRKALAFLVDNSILSPAEFTSTRYRPFTRYVRGNPSPYLLATSLRRASFLCHLTALELHELSHPNKIVYTNYEQEPKPEGDDLTQLRIRNAFKKKQRTTNYRFTYAGHEYVLINGKNTDRAGVVNHLSPEGKVVEVTNLERTLIDIAVRPAYAGGIQQVAEVYKLAISRIQVDGILKLLSKMNYTYPYQQSIGFLLERAGCNQSELRKLEHEKSEFDFFLDYGMKTPAYSERWQLFYPPSLD